jgi:FKBP-type peptidyl-prolyl cis-trans isomerase SlyD
MKIEKGHVVTFHYTLRNSEGDVIDSSENGNPLSYIHGYGHIIKGLETKLEGRAVGDKFDAVIAPKDAYGEVNQQLIQVVPKSGFEGDDELQVGIQVEVETEQGSRIAQVSKIEGKNVTLDLNHPLAGMQLFFKIELVGIRQATQEELDHGHVHGPGGHHH